MAPPPGTAGGGNAVTGFEEADGAGCVTGFSVGTCLPPGDCVLGVIAAEGVVGGEGFAAGICDGGVAGLVLSAGAGDGTAGVAAVADVDGKGFAAGL